MVPVDPYAGNKVSARAYADRVSLCARVVGILRGYVLDRGLDLILQPSRAIRAGEVHEVILTDQNVSPGSRVERVAYLAFVEFGCGGVLLTGDSVLVQGAILGKVAGFDLSHFPNHMNIVAKGELLSGEERSLRLGDTVLFRAVPGEH